MIVFLLYRYGDHRGLHSFPTRRSSDLVVFASFNKADMESGAVLRGSLGFTLTQNIFTMIPRDRKSTRLNSSHVKISYAVFCLKKKNCALHSLFTLYPHRDRPPLPFRRS